MLNLRLCDPDGEGNFDEAAHLSKAALEHKDDQDIIRCDSRQVKGFGANPIHLQGHFRCPRRQFEVQRFARLDPQQFTTVNLDDQLAENTKKPRSRWIWICLAGSDTRFCLQKRHHVSHFRPALPTCDRFAQWHE